MALGPLAKQIGFHRRRAKALTRVSHRCHHRAAQVGRNALTAKANGYHAQAKNMLARALRLKGKAVGAAGRARNHRSQIADLKLARRLYMQKHAG